MSFACEMDRPASGQRVLSVEVTEKERLYELSEDDYEVLLRIVEAEAGGEDEEGKMLVAGVVLNRVDNPAFPDTVREVVFQRENGTSQFSPAYNGRYEKVNGQRGDEGSGGACTMRGGYFGRRPIFCRQKICGQGQNEVVRRKADVSVRPRRA